MKWQRAGMKLYFLPLVLFFLSVATFLPAQAQQKNPQRTAVIFYADSHAGDQVWTPLFQSFRQELAQESREYPIPAEAELIPAANLAPGQDFSRILQVHLLGRCDVVQQAYRPLRAGPLGWVWQVSGEIQPFIYVNCERLAQILDPVTLGMNDEQRTHAMADAIARISVHEWIHIATQSGVHSNHGIERAELSADELVTAPQNASGQ